MGDRLPAIKQRVAEAAGRREVWLEQLTSAQAAAKHAEKEERTSAAAVAIVAAVGETLQNQAAERLSTVASHALRTVFPDPYAVEVEFNPTTRGTIDANVLFVRDDQRFRPVLPSGQLLAGGGPVEVAAWGLRVALWGQLRGRLRPVMLMDEPFRFLQESLWPVIGGVLAEIARVAGVQFIFVTHFEALVNGADAHVQEVGG